MAQNAWGGFYPDNLTLEQLRQQTYTKTREEEQKFFEPGKPTDLILPVNALDIQNNVDAQRKAASKPNRKTRKAEQEAVGTIEGSDDADEEL